MEKQKKYQRKKTDESDQKMELLDWVQCVVSALVVGILLFLFVGRVVSVEGSSMFPTLLDGDRVATSRLFYTPQCGDIVVVQTDTFGPKAIVKRVIATGGQTVDIDFEKGIVYVDGVALNEEYTAELTLTQEDFSGPVTVPEGCLFLMGDNRNASTDSRSSRVGMVDERCLIGKVYWILFPGAGMEGRRDFSRMGSVYS